MTKDSTIELLEEELRNHIEEVIEL